MSICEKAVYRWGLQDARTVAICTLVSESHKEVAEQLFEVLTKKD